MEKLNVPSRILMGPGPSDVHPRVLQAMATPMIGHMDPAFMKILDEVMRLLRYVFKQTMNSRSPCQEQAVQGWKRYS